MTGNFARTIDNRSDQRDTVVLEINDDAVGLLIPQKQGYVFDATDNRLQSWHNRTFASISEAHNLLSRVLVRAND